MVSARVIGNALRAAPVAALVVLVGWTLLDVFQVREARWTTPLLVLLAFGVGLFAITVAFRWTWVRPLGLGAIVAAYFAAHAFLLGVQVVAALVYLTLAIVLVELQILAEHFAPIYASPIGPVDQLRIRGALMRALLRLSVASALAILIPLLAADLAVAGAVPLTTIPTAILLAAALVAVVVVIALLPAFERRDAGSARKAGRGAKDN